MMRETSSADNPKTKRGIRPIPYSWIVVALAMSGLMGMSMPSVGLPMLYPFIREELTLSRAEIGLITSALAAGGSATAFVGGWFTDSLKVRSMMVSLLIAMALLIGMFQFIHTFTTLIVLAALFGMVQGPSSPTLARAIMEWIPRRTRGLATSIQQTGVPLTGTLTGATLPALAIIVGWRTAALLPAVVIVLIAVAFLWLYREMPSASATRIRPNMQTIKSLLRNRQLAMVTIWGATYSTLYYIIVIYVILFLIEVLNMSPIAAGGYLAAAQASSIVARIFWGALSDFVFGTRRVIVLGIVGFIATAGFIGMALINIETPQTVTVLLVICLGVTALSWPGVFIPLVGETAGPSQTGVSMGAVTTVSRVSQITVTPLFGLIVDMSGSYSVGWGITAGLALFSTIILIAFCRERLPTPHSDIS